MVKCDNCGYSNVEKAIVCIKCGNKLLKMDNVTINGNVLVNPSVNNSSVTNNRVISVASFIALLLHSIHFIVLFLLILWFQIDCKGPVDSCGYEALPFIYLIYLGFGAPVVYLISAILSIIGATKYRHPFNYFVLFINALPLIYIIIAVLISLFSLI